MFFEKCKVPFYRKGNSQRGIQNIVGVFNTEF